MSAIAGAVTLDGRPLGARDLAGVLEFLAPYGPDGIDTWDGSAGRCGVVVGVARRARVPEDVADRQPVTNADGSVVVVADAVLDNRRDLSAALGIPDHVDVSDSRFVLAAYERWGPDELPARLQGIFAIAVVDQRRGGVLLLRDHVGTRPLVLHQRPGIVAFATNALALTAFEGVGHDLDTERAAEVLALAFSSERTFVQGVQWVGHGETRWIDTRGVRARTWWQPDIDHLVDRGRSCEYAEELRDVLEVAVAAKLRTNGRVGAQLSGGLDSSSVAATAARMLAPEPLRTYTSVPPTGWSSPNRGSRVADERPAVEDLLAMHPTMQPSFVTVDGAGLFSMYEEQWELGAGPTRNPCNRLWIDAIYQDAAADGVRALLTGARGNLWFSADGPDWLVTLFRSLRWRQLAREARSWVGATEDSRWETWRNHLVAPLAPTWLRNAVRRRTVTPIEKWMSAIGLQGDLAEQFDTTRMPWLVDGRPHREAWMMTIGTGSTQADGNAAYGAFFGVDVADPTSDRRLMELALTQPELARRHDGITRAVAREAMADRLPASIVANRRRGEQLPDWLDRLTEGREDVLEELHALRDHPPSRELIDVARLDRLVQAWPELDQRADNTVTREYRLLLWRALVTSKYLRWFEDRGRRTASLRRPDAPVTVR